MAVIELGLLGQGDDGPPARPGRHPLGRRQMRQVLVAVVTVFCVLTATGSARPEPHSAAQLWAVPFVLGIDNFMLRDDTVFVLNRTEPGGLTAYDVRTGAVRWTTPDPADALWMSDLRAGVVLLPAAWATTTYQDESGSTVSREFARETVAVDAATGRQLWRQPGELVVTTAGQALLTEWARDGARVETFRVVRLSDGGEVWSRPAGKLAAWVTDTTPLATPDRLVTVDLRGHTRVLDLADGSEVAAGTLPWADGTPQDSDYTSVTMQGRQLYLDRSDGADAATLTAYDTGTLRALWQVEQPAGGGSFDCGPVLCLTTADGTLGYDRATGTRLWRAAGGTNGLALRDRLLLVDDDEAGPRYRLLDATTGRPVADLGPATPVWDQQLDRTLYLISQTREPADFMLISVLEESTGEVRLRGRIPVVEEYGCQSSAGRLACSTTDNRLVVTAVG